MRRPGKAVLCNSMRDSLADIKKAIETINRTENLTIHLTDPNAAISDEAPIVI